MRSMSLIKMEQIGKTFGAVKALENVDFELKKGEIHALLGENGAGKTTLMKVLYGMYRADKGSLYYEDKKVEINNSREAIELGIGMVHQHFMLIPELSVVENLVLGRHSRREPFLDLEEASEEIRKLSEMYGLDVDPKAKVCDLPVGSQQRVEIIKALYRGANVLILDEPTAVLAPQEAEHLGTVIRTLAEQGKTVIFITHKLMEARDLAHNITILRNGKTIVTVPARDKSNEELAQLMVGHPIATDLPRKKYAPGREALKISGLSMTAKDGKRLLDKINLTVHEGEIVAVAGVDGNGQSEVVEAVTGLRKITEGKVEFFNRDMSRTSVRDRIREGMGHIPQDRHKEGMALDMSLSDNMILETHGDKKFSRCGWIDYDKVNQYTGEMIEKYNVKATGYAAPAGSLSGGNQQKVVLAREVSREPKILIAAQPTRGLDISAVEFVHRKLLESRDSGVAILMISTELEECLSLSDRLAVMHQGRIMGVMNREEYDVEKIGLMIAGVHDGERKNEDKTER